MTEANRQLDFVNKYVLKLKDFNLYIDNYIFTYDLQRFTRVYKNKKWEFFMFLEERKLASQFCARASVCATTVRCWIKSQTGYYRQWIYRMYGSQRSL